MIPFAEWCPDRGPFSANSTDTAVNVLRSSNGIIPFPSPVSLSDSLGAQCYGAWWYRTTTGDYGFIAATKTNIYRLQSDGTWDTITRTSGGTYTGPDDNDLWQADRFGSEIYLTNVNDALQVLNVDSGTDFANAPGSPPRAKFIETVGDFLFLGYLGVGADDFPQDWQHSKINDPTDWVITGTAGDSDRQTIPDGDEIMGIFSCPGGARIIQRRCKRRLTFTPSSDFAFQMSDIDASRGSVAPNSIVNIGGDSYIYLHETGFYLNDAHQPVGAQRVDRWFFDTVDLSRLEGVQGIADVSQKIVWFRALNQDGAYFMFGWNWELDQWVYSDTQPTILVAAVAVGQVLDDLDSYGTLDDIDIPLDSRFWQGGRITFGMFGTDNILSLFTGSPAAVTIETATTELTPETGSYVYGAKLKGDISDYSIQLGSSGLMDQGVVWGASEMRDMRTGMCNFHNDDKYHRFRLNVAGSVDWNVGHGITPFFNESGFG